MPDEVKPDTAATIVPKKYEDCLALIAEAENLQDPQDLKTVLNRLKSFFTSRTAKKAREGHDDGAMAVKKAMESSSRYKKYEVPKVDGDAKIEGLFGGL